MPDTQRPPTIDPVAAARWERVAPATAPWLHEEVARRMEDRLQWIRLQPAAWAHWGAVRGGLQAHALLRRRYPQADGWVVEQRADLAAQARAALKPPWWSRFTRGAATPRVVPDLAPGAVQMLWSNMALHQAADPQALLARWHAALASDGFLMFSCLGPDTARELRAVYAAEGWPTPGHTLTDMHDWGDMLVAAGFAEPVMDMERITLTYATAARLVAEVRELGRNLHPGRFGALRGRGFPGRLEQALAQHLGAAAGDPAARQAQAPQPGPAAAAVQPGRAGQGPPEPQRLPLTFEIIYGHAFKPAPRTRLAAESSVSLEDMRSMLRRRPPGPP